ncbi:MAG: DUF2523 domain-containing protein [Colwellia sp.]|nr:DUF2523 domain-containing protein [Colwellia sp.]
MKKIILIVLLLVPLAAAADTYQDAAGTSQMLADYIDNMWTFLFSDVPTVIDRFMTWLLYYWVKMKLFAYYYFVKSAYGIAGTILADMNVMSQIASSMTLLPQDVRQMLVETRLFDGVNLLIQAWATKFVMRLI